MIRLGVQPSAPTTPPTGYGRIYPLGSDLFYLDDSGVSTNLTDTASGGGRSIPKVITVDSQGSEVIGESYNTLPDAVAYCNANATATNSLVIWLTKDIELSSGITIASPHYTICGLGQFATSIKVGDTLAGNTAITLDIGNASPIPSWNPLSNLRIVGSTILEATSNTEAIDFRSNGVAYFHNLRLENFNVGFRFDNDFLGKQFAVLTGQVIIRDAVTGFICGNTDTEVINCVLSECSVGIELTANSEFTLRSGLITSAPSEVGSNTGVRVNTTGNVVLGNLEIKDLNIGVIVDTATKVSFAQCIFRDSTTTHGIINASAIINTNSTEIDLRKVTLNDPDAKITGIYFDTNANEPSVVVAQELSVGLPQSPEESAFGGGRSSAVGLLGFTFDGTTYVNVSDAMSREDGSTVSFPNNVGGNAIYFSNIYGLKFTNLKLDLSANANLGVSDIAFEYWNGTSWAEVNHMLTLSSDTYLPYGNNKMEVGESIHLIFDYRMNKDWASNDPPLIGISRYWLRMRLTGTLNTLPVIDKVKVGTDRSKINKDGKHQYFGYARVIKQIPSPLASAGGGNSTPSDQNLYRSDNIFAGRTGNSFSSNQDNSTGTIITLPFDLDTSCPIRLHVVYRGSVIGNGGVVFSIRWDYFSDGDIVYGSTSTAPTTTATQRSLQRTDTINISSVGEVNTSFFDLEIPEAIAQRLVNGVTEQGDIVMLTFERLGTNAADTYSGTIDLVDFLFFYTSWRGGGHLKAEI